MVYTVCASAVISPLRPWWIPTLKVVWKCVTRSSILFICNTFCCWLEPGLYSSRRLSAAVPYSFVVRAGDYGRYRKSSSKCVQVLCKFKQSPDRTAKWSVHGIEIQMQIQIRIQISWLTCIYNILCDSWMAHTLSACYRVSLYMPE